MADKTEVAARQTIRVVLQMDTTPGEAGDEVSEDIKLGANYLPGDHLAVYPENNVALVDAIVDRLLRSEPNRNTYADRPYLVKIKAQGSMEQATATAVAGAGAATSNGDISPGADQPPPEPKWVLHERLPAPVSLREALLRYLDITTPPTQQFLALAVDYAEAKKDAERLRHLAADSAAYETWKAAMHPTLLEVLNEVISKVVVICCCNTCFLSVSLAAPATRAGLHAAAGVAASLLLDQFVAAGQLGQSHRVDGGRGAVPNHHGRSTLRRVLKLSGAGGARPSCLGLHTGGAQLPHAP